MDGNPSSGFRSALDSDWGSWMFVAKTTVILAWSWVLEEASVLYLGERDLVDTMKGLRSDPLSIRRKMSPVC